MHNNRYNSAYEGFVSSESSDNEKQAFGMTEFDLGLFLAQQQDESAGIAEKLFRNKANNCDEENLNGNLEENMNSNNRNSQIGGRVQNPFFRNSGLSIFGFRKFLSDPKTNSILLDPSQRFAEDPNSALPAYLISTAHHEFLSDLKDVKSAVALHRCLNVLVDFHGDVVFSGTKNSNNTKKSNRSSSRNTHNISAAPVPLEQFILEVQKSAFGSAKNSNTAAQKSWPVILTLICADRELIEKRIRDNSHLSETVILGVRKTLTPANAMGKVLIETVSARSVPDASIWREIAVPAASAGGGAIESKIEFDARPSAEKEFFAITEFHSDCEAQSVFDEIANAGYQDSKNSSKEVSFDDSHDHHDRDKRKRKPGHSPHKSTSNFVPGSNLRVVQVSCNSNNSLNNASDITNFWRRGVQRVATLNYAPENCIFDNRTGGYALRIKKALKPWRLYLKPLLVERNDESFVEHFHENCSHFFDENVNVIENNHFSSFEKGSKNKKQSGKNKKQSNKRKEYNYGFGDAPEESEESNYSESASSSSDDENDNGRNSNARNNYNSNNDNSSSPKFDSKTGYRKNLQKFCANSNAIHSTNCSAILNSCNGRFAKRNLSCSFTVKSFGFGKSTFPPQSVDTGVNCFAPNGGMEPKLVTNSNEDHEDHNTRDIVLHRHGKHGKLHSHDRDDLSHHGHKHGSHRHGHENNRHNNHGSGHSNRDESTLEILCPRPETAIFILQLHYRDSVTGKKRCVAHFASRVVDLKPGVRWVSFEGNELLRGNKMLSKSGPE